MRCSCPMSPPRNNIACPRHVLSNPAMMAYLHANPLFAIVADEMDLNWATHRMDRLFWQHTHIEEWAFA